MGMTDMTPTRIQRKRSKGWKLPPNTKCVTRPGPFGNPFTVNPKLWEASRKKRATQLSCDELHACNTAEQAVRMYEDIVKNDKRLREIIVRDLRGFNLACYCPEGSPCHGDVLLRIANE
jgi:hypothetical protein